MAAELPKISAGVSQRKPIRRTSWARLVQLLVVAAFFACLAGVVVSALWKPTPKRVDSVLVVREPPDKPSPPSPANVTRPEAPVEPTPKLSPESQVAAPGRLEPASLKPAEILARVEAGIVKIESGGPAGRGNLGSGFVIDSSGLVATNYHVIDEATVGQVCFKSGAVYEIAGYAAVEPSHDLAILRIKDPPPNLAPLKLCSQDDPPPLSPVVAIGHPRGVAFSPYDGKVSRVITTRELPVASQQFLARHLSSQLNLQWIQHTANISEGNSGGPLINEQGEVIGINTWVDRESDFAYALPVRYLTLLQERLLAETAPLERFASKAARTNDAVARLSVERLEQLFAEAQALRFRPSNSADYETLQQLAWAVTYPKFSGNLGGVRQLDATLLEALAKASDRVEAALRKQKLDAFGQFTLINEFAADQVSRPQAGLFFIGTVERIVEGDEGSRGMLMKLAGFDQPLFLPLDGSLFSAAPGTHCLVLGVNAGGRTVRYGENPLRPITAPVIVSRTILPLNE